MGESENKANYSSPESQSLRGVSGWLPQWASREISLKLACVKVQNVDGRVPGR